MMKMPTMAQRIKKLRCERNLTQSELADIAGVSRTCVSNWEKGIRIPESVSILKITKYFGVTVDYLCGRCEERNKVIAPPTFKMDISKLNKAGQDALLTFYKFLLTDEKYKNDMHLYGLGIAEQSLFDR